MAEIKITIADDHTAGQVSQWLKQRLPVLIPSLVFKVKLEPSITPGEHVKIRGEIAFPDGEVAQFSADSSGEFLQWGDGKRTPAQTVLAVEEISRVLATEFGDESHG